MMVISVRDAATAHGGTSAVAPLRLYQQPRSFDPRDMRALIQDFFSWIEYEWQQPVLRDGGETLSALLELVASINIPLAEYREYTRRDLTALTGYNRFKVASDVTKHRVALIGRLHHQGSTGLGPGIYLGRDLAPVVEEWEWDELCAVIDTIWARYVKEPCGGCDACRRSPNIAVFRCQKNNSHSIRVYRQSFYYLLRALRKYGDIESWWDHECKAVFECRQGAITEPTKLILLYMLDRHLLDLTFDDILRISFRGIDYIDLLRPFRHRRPEEYASLLRGMEMAQYGEQMRYDILALLAVLVLLKNGFPGLTELGWRLRPEEVQQVVQEGRLLTPHLGYGIDLGLPLSDDVCVGHVVLDEIREYFWKYSADLVQQTGRPLWDQGPRCWSIALVNALERVLTANVWNNGQALLTPRSETELARINPYRSRQRAEQVGGHLDSLSAELGEAIQAFISYRYQQKHIELSTIATDLRAIFSFFSWAKGYTDVSRYTSWDRDTMRDIAHAFLAAKRSTNKDSYLSQLLVKVHVFFETLAEIGLPHPTGYAILRTLLPSYDRGSSAIPTEEVLDRLFRDGVCRLDYDPYARLALTIQYFCGTRVMETCDLPVFCIVEDADGRFAYLVIPRGKSKQERSFPIVSTGMGPLLDYMDQVVKLQVDDDGQLRNFSRTNVRYLETDTEKAYYWDYLFDRQHYSAGRACRRMRVLNPARVGKALKEAILLAAKQNPEGFFQQETYSPSCRRCIREGQECGYLSLQDGVTVCPVCGGLLPGRRGHRCGHRVAKDIKCDGVARDGSYFCPRCDAPLADLVDISSHTFRHNSVTRAHRHGVPLAENMLLHGHQTVPMHLRYLHLLPEDQQDAVHRVFSEKLLRDLQRETSFSPGQIIEDGVAHTVNLAQYFGHTLRRELKRGTFGLWGGFWIGALAEEGTTSPIRQKANIIVTEDTYDHMVAQYRYEALCLAISEVALERGTKGKFKATIAPFLERREIDQVVSAYLEYVQQGYLSTARGVRLIEADIKAQRLFLDELAEMLRPWWQHLGSVDRLVSALFPEKDVFVKVGESYAIEQEYPPAESAS